MTIVCFNVQNWKKSIKEHGLNPRVLVVRIVLLILVSERCEKMINHPHPSCHTSYWNYATQSQYASDDLI